MSAALPRAPIRPDLIFRLDELPPAVSAAATCPSPAHLFIDITAKSKSILTDLHLASIRWTAKGNLTLVFWHDEDFSAEKARKQVPFLWDFIRSSLKLPKHHMPRVDAGNSWHNVVVHSAPIKSEARHRNISCTHQESALSGVSSWLQESSVVGNIQAMSFMCRDADLVSRDTAPLRISLESQTDADLLVQNRALVLGTQCRVSPYTAKPQV
ncbi:hypothetical protein K438DRAFT_1830742 [Mycena galopus ATCC 62051]|nr:hypothetical protein K438DRAFT_1830742 [Mycena galopus ATCC 62051]